MATTIANGIKAYLKGLLGVHSSSTTDTGGMVDRVFHHTLTSQYAASSTTTNVDTVNSYFWEAQNNQTVLVATILSANLTASSTNYATFNLLKANGGGGTATVVATKATTATNVVAGVPYDLTLNTSAGATLLNTGEVMALQILKSGSGGLTMLAGKIVVQVEER